MYVCVCHAITDHDIRAAADDGVTSIEELGDELKVGTCCGRCKDCANKVLQSSLMDGYTHNCCSHAA